MLSSRWLPPFLLLQVLQISICDDDWLSRMRARDEARMRYYELEEKREMISRERRSKETLKEKIAQVCFRVTMSKKLATMSKKTWQQCQTLNCQAEAKLASLPLPPLTSTCRQCLPLPNNATGLKVRFMIPYNYC